MASPDANTTRWRKSSYSNGDGGQCVEVADAGPGPGPGSVLVRDSKVVSGPVLLLKPAAWGDFLRSL